MDAPQSGSLEDAVAFARGFVDAEWAAVTATFTERDQLLEVRATRTALKFLAKGFRILRTAGMRPFNAGPELWERAPALLAQFRQRRLFAVTRTRHRRLGDLWTLYVSAGSANGMDGPLYRMHAVLMDGERRIAGAEARCSTCRASGVRGERPCEDCRGRGWQNFGRGQDVGSLPAPAEAIRLVTPEDEEDRHLLDALGA